MLAIFKVSVGVFLVVVLGEVLASGPWRWEGKVAVVTGASSGIGAATALALADKGVIVVGLARREDRIKELAGKTTGKIHALKCDLTKESDIVHAFKWVEVTLGGVDILVNNAGIFKIASILTGPTELWKAVMDVNVLAVTICGREALKTMRKRGDDGHIIYINSVAGHHVLQQAVVPEGLYSASKFAVTAITETVRLELMRLNSNIKITSVSPGVVNTELVTNLTTEVMAQLKAENKELPTYALALIGADDVAEAIIYTLSTKPNVQIRELQIQGNGHSMC